jgi:hypothetical protein
MKTTTTARNLAAVAVAERDSERVRALTIDDVNAIDSVLDDARKYLEMLVNFLWGQTDGVNLTRGGAAGLEQGLVEAIDNIRHAQDIIYKKIGGAR